MATKRELEELLREERAQKSSLVIEALERGIAEYGEPREVLTDQGRQYAAWRGETEFQELLRRYGIAHAHSTSRPQHPETLGKIERFWKTLWEEFLRKTVFADFADCLRRVALFVQHYNFQRPHQGIDGLVPADRFFRRRRTCAPRSRRTYENALRLAQEKFAAAPRLRHRCDTNRLSEYIKDVVPYHVTCCHTQDHGAPMKPGGTSPVGNW